MNAALEGHPELLEKKAEDLIKDLNSLPEDVRVAVRNNGGGYVNHALFWTLLRKDVECSGKILEKIEEDFGSFEDFRKKFSEVAMGVFGSGWAWLVVSNGKLEIVKTSNQDSPLSSGMTPVLTLDVWEHAYYLKYMNKRADYIEAFWNVVNWEKVNELYGKAVL